MLKTISTKLNRLKIGFKKDGFTYLFYASTSYIPRWLFFFSHDYLFTAINLKLVVREYADYNIKVADMSDVDAIHRMENYSDNRMDRVRKRLELSHFCVLVKKNEQVVSIGWTATGRIFMPTAGVILDTGKDGFSIDDLYTVHAERMKGLHIVCIKREFEHFRNQGRFRAYGIINSYNKNSLKTHKRMGFEVCGESNYLILFGLSICYYKSWPHKTKKIHIFFKNPPEYMDNN